MKRIYVVEELCNGCRLCESFCGSLSKGIFSPQSGRIRVLKVPGGEKSVPMVHCDGRCVRPIYEDGSPTCVRVCPTGALIFAEHERAVQVRQEYEAALGGIEEAISEMKEIALDSSELKRKALIWVYITEYLAVSGTCMATGFLLWTLMVKRRLYREVGLTRGR